MSSKIEYFAENINHLQVVICDLCQKYFNGRIPYEQHLQSKNHKKKLQEKILLEKMEMKIHQPVLSKDGVNTETGLCNYSMVGDTIPTKDISETFHFKQPERYLASDDKVERLAGSFPVSAKKTVCTGRPIHSLLSTCSHYDKCNVCVKSFSTAEAAQIHIASQEHKTKVDTQRQLELILSRYREMNLTEPSKFCNQVDKSKLMESAMASECLTKQPYADASFPVKVLNANEQRIHPKYNFYSPSSKVMLDKMPPVDLPMTSSVDTSHYASKSNEQKTFPGCDICGIKSFVTLNASFNHSLTLEHCRKFAMYSKTSEPHTFSPENYTPSTLCTNSPIPSNCLNNEEQFKLPNVKFHMIPQRIGIFGNPDSNSKFEESASSSQVNTASLYPIGYERKMKCKQIEEQNTGNAFHEIISLPDSFNVDYGLDFFVNPESLYDSPTSLLPNIDSGTECTQPETNMEHLKYVNRRRSRLLNSNISPSQKEDDFTIFPEENFHF